MTSTARQTTRTTPALIPPITLMTATPPASTSTDRTCSRSRPRRPARRRPHRPLERRAHRDYPRIRRAVVLHRSASAYPRPRDHQGDLESVYDEIHADRDPDECGAGGVFDASGRVARRSATICPGSTPTRAPTRHGTGSMSPSRPFRQFRFAGFYSQRIE